MAKVTKAIIAAAGLGTRFLPQTKAMPKEMLPIIDKPVIQIIVEEAVAAGVTDVIIVTGAQKRALEDHFDRAVDLEEALKISQKQAEADEIKRIAEIANFIYVRQKGEPKGNARPLINAAHLLGDEPFFVFFADDFFVSEVPRAQQLLDAYQETQTAVISLVEVDKKATAAYGIVSVRQRLSDNLVQIDGVVEKPGPEAAPSNLASVGGYLLTPDILPIVAQVQSSERGEIELVTALNELAQRGLLHGRFIDGQHYDAGNKLGYLKAVVDAGLKHPRLGPDFKRYLEKRLN